MQIRNWQNNLIRTKALVENANVELGKLAEFEQEKTAYANTKQKLSLALKHALADKTRELEKCLIELQENLSALDSAEQGKDLLPKSEILAVHLQESLSQKDSMLQKYGEILSESGNTVFRFN